MSEAEYLTLFEVSEYQPAGYHEHPLVRYHNLARSALWATHQALEIPQMDDAPAPWRAEVVQYRAQRLARAVDGLAVLRGEALQAAVLQGDTPLNVSEILDRVAQCCGALSRFIRVDPLKMDGWGPRSTCTRSMRCWARWVR